MVRIFRGGTLDERVEGSVVVIGPRPTTMTGLVRGDLFVRDNSVCDVTGMVSGNLLAERTGKASLHGLVTKAAKAAGGDLEIFGMVQGDVINEGGRLFVDKTAVVRGKIVGQTPQAPIPPREKAAVPPAPAAPLAAPTPAPKPPAPPAPPSSQG